MTTLLTVASWWREREHVRCPSGRPLKWSDCCSGVHSELSWRFMYDFVWRYCLVSTMFHWTVHQRGQRLVADCAAVAVGHKLFYFGATENKEERQRRRTEKKAKQRANKETVKQKNLKSKKCKLQTNANNCKQKLKQPGRRDDLCGKTLFWSTLYCKDKTSGQRHSF